MTLNTLLSKMPLQRICTPEVKVIFKPVSGTKSPLWKRSVTRLLGYSLG